MRRERMEHREGQLVFCGEDSTAGYWVLFAVLLFLGGSMGWWWPEAIAALATAPWERVEWTHTQVITGSVFLALIGGFFAVIGGYVSDRRRRHEIAIDDFERTVEVQEWWRNLELSLRFPPGIFDESAVKRPVEHREKWELGVVLNNGSYWRLFRGDENEVIEAKSDVDEQAVFNTDTDDAGPELTDRVEVTTDGNCLRAAWRTHEKLTTRIATLLATICLVAAAFYPALVAFDGIQPANWAAIALGTIAFAGILVIDPDSRAKWPLLGVWFAATVGAVVGFGAHWAYYPIATVLGGIFGVSAGNVVRQIWSPSTHSIRVDGNRIYEDGDLVEDGNEVIGVDELEGAVANLTEIRPVEILLVSPGGGDTNRAEHLGQKKPQPPEEREPIELTPRGLSPFETIGLSLVLHDWIRRR